jgi:NAD-dependent dihydropyrimidine dehydrogenase PreA subunit
VNGVCSLCNKSKDLIDSHFMPKAVYRIISKGFPESGENIVWISGHEKSAAYTSKQAKKHLLCANCEAVCSVNYLVRFGQVNCRAISSLFQKW